MGRAADRLGRIERNLRSLPEQAVADAATLGKAAAIAELKADAGADQKLSGVRNGVAQTVVVKTETRLGAQYAQTSVKAGPQRQRAPWFWLEEGTKPGNRGARRRRASGQVGRAGGNHPGTPAKRTWSRAMAVVAPAVKQKFEQLFSKAVDG